MWYILFGCFSIWQISDLKGPLLLYCFIAGKVKKKVVLFLEIGQAIFLFYLPAHIFDCVSEYIHFVSKNDITKAQKQTKKQKKITKKRDIENKPKKKRRKKMLLWTVSVENLTMRQNSLLKQFSTCKFVCRNRLFFFSNNKR